MAYEDYDNIDGRDIVGLNPTCGVTLIDIPQSREVHKVSDVWEHSTDERYFIIASNVDADRKALDAYMVSNGIGFKPLIGRYEGEFEYSYIFNARDWDRIKHLPYFNQQKEILYLWPYAYGYRNYGIDARMASIYNVRSGERTDLGVIIPANVEQIDVLGDWTFDPATDMYYHVVKGEKDKIDD